MFAPGQRWDVIVPVGLVIGLSLGALGGGGSILTVPALVYLLGQGPREATTGSLIVVGLTSLVALVPHARRGRVRFAQGLAFGALGTVGSLVGSALAAHVAPTVLLAGFAALMLLVATLMVRRTRARAAGAADVAAAGGRTDLGPMLSLRPLSCACPRLMRLLVTASVVGLLTGFFGVGGGFVLVPALVLALSFDMPTAVGTSLLVIAVNSTTALLARANSGTSPSWPVLGAFTALAVAGSLVGGRLATRVSPRVLTRAFSVLLVGVALYTAARSVPLL